MRLSGQRRNCSHLQLALVSRKTCKGADCKTKYVHFGQVLPRKFYPIIHLKIHIQISIWTCIYLFCRSKLSRRMVARRSLKRSLKRGSVRKPAPIHHFSALNGQKLHKVFLHPHSFFFSHSFLFQLIATPLAGD